MPHPCSLSHLQASSPSSPHHRPSLSSAPPQRIRQIPLTSFMESIGRSHHPREAVPCPHRTARDLKPMLKLETSRSEQFSISPLHTPVSIRIGIPHAIAADDGQHIMLLFRPRMSPPQRLDSSHNSFPILPQTPASAPRLAYPLNTAFLSRCLIGALISTSQIAGRAPLRRPH